MGLIDLKTDLKSLTYSSMPLGSDAPYVTKDVNDPPSSNRFSMQVTKRVDDLSRITQMLIDKPGLKYLGNEALLQQIHNLDKIGKAQNKGKAVLDAVKNTIAGTGKIALSTLAQVPVNGTGTHFLKGFRTDTYLSPSSTNDFAEFFGAGGVEGAPFALRGETVPGKHKTELLTNTRSSNFDYVGGDVFADRNETLNVPTGSNQAKLNAQIGAPIIVSPDGYIQTTETKGNLPGSLDNKISGSSSQVSANKTIRDFRTGAKNVDGTSTAGAAYVENSNIDYASQNMESRIGIGRQGKDRSKDNYRKKDRQTIDQVNALKIGTKRQSANNEARDLAKFFFEIITPDNKIKLGDKQETTGNFIHFRAYIDSIDDSYTADWQGHRYVGRAENFLTYGGFDRDINISFKIAAMTRSELKPLYKKMVYLASTTAPTYSDTFMRGTVVKLSVGSYFVQQPGVITSVKYSLVQDMPWEIAMQGPEGGEKDVQELPMGLQCSVSFKPIHNFAPQTGLFNYFTSDEGKAKFFTPTEHKNIIG